MSEDELQAFPCEEYDLPGMTLRDYFAAKAMAALSPQALALYEQDPATRIDMIKSQRQRMAETCYGLADAMIAERKKQ